MPRSGGEFGRAEMPTLLYHPASPPVGDSFQRPLVPMAHPQPPNIDIRRLSLGIRPGMIDDGVLLEVNRGS